MKIRVLFLLSMLVSAGLANAMDNGVRVADAKYFDAVLKIGTQKAITQWVEDNKLDLNTRCIKVENYLSRGNTKYMYPIERIVTRYNMSGKKLHALLLILIGLKVPIDGYDDYNPLLHAIGARFSIDIITVLYNVGANPTKRVLSYHAQPCTPQEYIQKLLVDERAIKRVNDLERIAELEKMQKLFESKRLQSNSPVHSYSSIAASTAGGVTQQATITNNTLQPNQNAAAQNNQTINNQLSKPMLFTVRQATGIAVVSVLCGVGLTVAYDWYFVQTQHDAADDEQESVDELV